MVSLPIKCRYTQFMQGMWQKIGALWVAVLIAVGILGTAALLTYQTTITSAHPADALPASKTALYIHKPTTQLLKVVNTLYPTIAIADTVIPENVVALFYVQTTNGLQSGFIMPAKASTISSNANLVLQTHSYSYYLPATGILTENQVTPLSLHSAFKTLTNTKQTSSNFVYIGKDIIKANAPETLLSIEGTTLTIDSIANNLTAANTPHSTIRLLPNGRMIHTSNLQSLIELWRQKTSSDQETIQMAKLQHWWNDQVQSQMSIAYEVAPAFNQEVAIEYSSSQSGTTVVALHGKRTQVIDALLQRAQDPSSTYSAIVVERALGDFNQRNVRLGASETTAILTETIGDWTLNRIPKNGTELIIGNTKDQWLLTNQSYEALKDHLEANEQFTTIEPNSIVTSQLVAHGSSQSFLPLEQISTLQIQNWSTQQLQSIYRIRLELLKQAL